MTAGTRTHSQTAPPLLQTILAFAAIYFLWGSTFLAIRVAVLSVPPLFAAGWRFVLAGGLLFGWACWRGEVRPTRLQWRNMALLASLVFLMAYGGLFWAEKSVPSGIASLFVGTIPICTAILQILVFRKELFRWSLVLSIALGIAGLCTVALDSTANLQVMPCLVILLAQACWSMGTVLSKVLDVPKSMTVHSGAQMLLGGIFLLIASLLLGEWRPLPHVSLETAAAIVYLSVAGSIVAFTAYVWLLDKMPATVVTSYAYVNPVVALFIGHWLGKEALDLRTLLGAALVLTSVLVTVTGPKPVAATSR